MDAMNTMGGAAAREPGLPVGRWTHAFEEDEEGGAVEVYRPSEGTAFAPARRGREVLEFRADGSVVLGAPGPDDRSRSTTHVVRALGMNRFELSAAADAGGAAPASPRVIELLESSAQRLKLRWR